MPREPEQTREQVAAFYRDVMRPLFGPLMRYHRFRVEGFEHLPSEGRALVIGTHAAVTYDLILVLIDVQQRTGRVIHGLADDLLFEAPILRSTIGRLGRGVGSAPASPASARDMLNRDRIVGVAPGGMWEALRPRTQRHQVRWERRRGFVRLALETRAPIVLSTCPRSDLVYDVYPSRLTDAVYRRFKLPLPLMRGVGPTWLPRPEPLTHYLAAPIPAPAIAGARATDAEVDAFHTVLRTAVDAHIAACCRREGLAP
jgi:1-acyl-sn-glycerol-3-phosphate acyltransferase